MMREKIYDDKYYEPTPKSKDYLRHRYKKILKIFSKCNFERILDVGCSDGSFSILLKEASSAKEVYGIETSEARIKSARENGVKVFSKDIDKDDFPFEDEYFDAIFAGEVIEHLFDPDHLLDEMHRMLKRGVFA